MLDHMPFPIKEDILVRLPVKSLIKFRSVSKSWMSLIVSTDFIAAHSRRRHTQPEHLLVRYQDQSGSVKTNYVSLVDDETFPQQRFVPTLPLSIKHPLIFPRIIGSSHGVLCVKIGISKVLLWNPSIRKSIPIQLPATLYNSVSFFLSFGVCPITTLDTKIVYIRQVGRWCHKKNKYSKHSKVMLYTLSSGKWRKLFINNNLRSTQIMHTGPQVIIDRFIYWSAYYPLTFPTPQFHNLIMSFDMSNESFEVIHLPHTLACHPDNSLSVSKVNESLVVFESSENTENQSVFVAWMMKHDDVQRSFTKLYTIDPQHESVMKVIGFRKSGQPIMEVKDVDSVQSKRVVYEPDSNDFCDFEVYGESDNYFVNSYEETLLLLDRCECSGY